MSVVNLGNVVGLIKSPTAPDKNYVLWFNWTNYPTVPEEGDLYYYDHGSAEWVLLVTGGTNTSYTRSDTIKVSVGGIIIGEYRPNGTIQKLLDDMLYPFINPSATFGFDNAPFEKGVTVNSIYLNYIILPKDGIITSRILKRNATTIYAPSGDSGTYNYTGGVQVGDSTLNKRFSLVVNFSNHGAIEIPIDTPFVAPTWFGTLALADIHQSNIQTLNKLILTQESLDNQIISPSPTTERMVIAYPQTFGLLTGIFDPHNINILESFLLLDESGINTFTLADGITTEDYYVYYNDIDTTQTDFKLTLKFD